MRAGSIEWFRETLGDEYLVEGASKMRQTQTKDVEKKIRRIVKVY